MPNTYPTDGALARGVQHLSRAATRRPGITITLWLLLVVICVMAGGSVGTKSLTNAQSEVGEAARADRIIAEAHLTRPAQESILVRSGNAASTSTAVRLLETKLRTASYVATIHGPSTTPSFSRAGGRTALVEVTLKGNPDQAGDHVGAVQQAVRQVAAGNRRVTLEEAGDGTFDKAFVAVAGTDLGHAELLSLPITLLILVLAFGAIVAASVPLLLGVTSVVAALGAQGLVSQIAPVSHATSSVILLIGLAVGVDYSLFYIRRVRDERARGRDPVTALEVASATVGRAIVISGLTVMVALAGLLLTGAKEFMSIGLATMVVVAIAVLGSVTVLPAVLAKLGDRVDRGGIPVLARLRARRAGSVSVSDRLARLVTTRPLASLVIAVCVLATLAVPVVQMRTADPNATDLPTSVPVRAAYDAIEHAFPGTPQPVLLVFQGKRLGSLGERHRLQAIGHRALEVTGGRGQVGVDVAHDGRVAVVSVPMPYQGGLGRAKQVVETLRATVARSDHALVTGAAAASLDFANRLQSATPLVIAVVMVLAFMLLLAAFRSAKLAATVIGLNLLSVGAAYGVLVAVFEHHWAESLLGFTSNGTIVSWLPLFALVVLFGLSMDYTVLVLERVQEGRRAGLSARDAAAEGVAATGGAVTSAALVMVFVFAVFATLGLLEFKQLGVGLSAAVLIDATIVRGVALPAAIALLGDRGWQVRRATPRWDHPVRVPALAHEIDAR